MHVVGTITAVPGVILGDSTIAIQDVSGGIYVRVPDVTLPGLVLGSVVDVIGANGRALWESRASPDDDRCARHRLGTCTGTARTDRG